MRGVTDLEFWHSGGRGGSLQFEAILFYIGRLCFQENKKGRTNEMAEQAKWLVANSANLKSWNILGGR